MSAVLIVEDDSKIRANLVFQLRDQGFAPTGVESAEAALHALRGTKHVTDIRNFGLAGAVQIEAIPGEPTRHPFAIALKCWEKGLYVRWAGDTVQLGPPLVSERHELEQAIAILGDVIPTVA